MYSKKIEEYKKSLKLTKRQREIIVGTLLGDGHLEALPNKRVYRLKIEHSIKQKEYVDWLWSEFKEWVSSPPRERTKMVTLPQGTRYKSASYGFTTYSHGALRFYAHQFYSKEGKKIIPKLIDRLFTPLSLAVWFMDDGSWKSNKHHTFIFHTFGYARAELERLALALKKRFSIMAGLHKQKKKYWRVYVYSDSADHFRQIIEPYMRGIQSMSYKLGNIMPKK